jgi:NAD+ kinase
MQMDPVSDNREISTAVLFVNLRKAGSNLTAGEIHAELEKRNVQTTVFTFDRRPSSCPKGKWDIAFSLGGDGTVLYTARMMAPAGTPILPLHFGNLGFLAGVERHEWLAAYLQWLNGTARISSRCMLDIFIERDGMTVMRNICLNDAVISSTGIAKLINLKVKTEITCGEYTGLGCYRSDGLIVATPTGSTAYSMAAGGPILDPEMDALIVNPICPFTLSNRPIVLPSRQSLIVTVEKEQRSGVLLTVDGQDTFELKGGDEIIIRQSLHYARIVTLGRESYYSALLGKLSWGNATFGRNGVSEGDGISEGDDNA